VAKRTFRRSVRRHKDLVWITTIIDASVLEVTPTDIGQIVLSGDWSGGNVGFDRCTLMGIRGWLSATQSAVATAGETTGMYGALYVTDGQVPANAMDASVATEYAIFDTIWTFGCGMTSVSNVSTSQNNWSLDVKAKRKLTTAQDVRLAVVVGGADTGSPRMGFNGCVRALLMLDPP